jgi:hypothetical protein
MASANASAPLRWKREARGRAAAIQTSLWPTLTLLLGKVAAQTGCRLSEEDKPPSGRPKPSARPRWTVLLERGTGGMIILQEKIYFVIYVG